MNISEMVERKANLEKRKSRLQAKLEVAKEKREEIYKELQDLGIDPDNIEEALATLQDQKIEMEKEIQSKIETATAVLNRIEERVNNL